MEGIAKQHQKKCIPELKLSHSMMRMIDQFPSPYAIRDLEGRLIYGNQPVVELYGVKSTKDIFGKMDAEIKSKIVDTEEAVNEFAKQYRQVCQTEIPFATLELHPAAVDYPYIFNKFPFYNDDNKCVGMFGYARKLAVYTLNDYIKGFMPGSLLLNKPDDFFTERQCEIMFYRLQGLKAKEVAKRLNLSENTICNYMQTLYDKANVVNLAEFKHFCEQRNYHRYLPKRFLSNKPVDFACSII